MQTTAPGIGRRTLLALLTLTGAAALVRQPEAAATNATVAGQELTAIAANPSFTFATDLAGAAGSGETSPIDTAYRLGTYEVTNAQYLEFITDSGRDAPSYWDGGTYPDGKADHPVLEVSLDPATAYCAWLTGRVDTDALTYPWGDTAGTTYVDLVLTSKYNCTAVCAACELAVYGDESATYTAAGSDLYGDESATYTAAGSDLYGQSFPISEILSIGSTGTVSGRNVTVSRTGFVHTDVYDALTDTGGCTTPVTAYPGGISADGVWDLCGNCWEWITSVITATHGGEMDQQVDAIRGGSWYANLNSCTAIHRGEGRDASGRCATVGFRVAATPRTG
ncbi:formylglycine-generating enzyme family protein [Streptomyces sp. NPDC002817]|uniref:formylglycine-generating enzyme family protein n=1 Tax=Streptomyces sp. NPDC088357 TaxID=3154655 RepID=UPI00342116C5